MNDKLYSELAAENAQKAVINNEKTRNELLDRMKHLEGVVAQLEFKYTHLEQKYNLLLTKNFSGGPTSGD